MMQLAKGGNLGVDALKFVVRIGNLAEVENAHIHIGRAACRIYTNNPETKEIGSGIDAENGSLASQ